MSKDNHAFEVSDVDPWVKRNRAAVPRGALLVCIYNLDLGAVSVVEALYLRQLTGRVELWLAHPCSQNVKEATKPAGLTPTCTQGCAVKAVSSDDSGNIAQALFVALVRSRWGHAWPAGFHEAGLLSEEAYSEILATLTREGDDVSARALLNETSVVVAARELRLHPEPTGTSPSAWRARCPETNHSLYINTDADEFWCGYCRRKGGEDELRAFAHERQQRRVALTQNPGGAKGCTS